MPTADTWGAVYDALRAAEPDGVTVGHLRRVLAGAGGDAGPADEDAGRVLAAEELEDTAAAMTAAAGLTLDATGLLELAQRGGGGADNDPSSPTPTKDSSPSTSGRRRRSAKNTLGVSNPPSGKGLSSPGGGSASSRDGGVGRRTISYKQYKIAKDNARRLYSQLFRIADRDASGEVTKDEFRLMMSVLTPDATDGEIRKHFASVDEDDSKSISFDEFAGLMEQVPFKLDVHTATTKLQQLFSKRNAEYSRRISTFDTPPASPPPQAASRGSSPTRTRDDAAATATAPEPNDADVAQPQPPANPPSTTQPPLANHSFVGVTGTVPVLTPQPQPQQGPQRVSIGAASDDVPPPPHSDAHALPSKPVSVASVASHAVPGGAGFGGTGGGGGVPSDSQLNSVPHSAAFGEHVESASDAPAHPALPPSPLASVGQPPSAPLGTPRAGTVPAAPATADAAAPAADPWFGPGGALAQAGSAAPAPAQQTQTQTLHPRTVPAALPVYYTTSPHVPFATPPPGEELRWGMPVPDPTPPRAAVPMPTQTATPRRVPIAVEESLRRLREVGSPVYLPPEAAAQDEAGGGSPPRTPGRPPTREEMLKELEDVGVAGSPAAHPRWALRSPQAERVLDEKAKARLAKEQQVLADGRAWLGTPVRSQKDGRLYQYREGGADGLVGAPRRQSSRLEELEKQRADARVARAMADPTRRALAREAEYLVLEERVRREALAGAEDSCRRHLLYQLWERFYDAGVAKPFAGLRPQRRVYRTEVNLRETAARGDVAKEEALMREELRHRRVLLVEYLRDYAAMRELVVSAFGGRWAWGRVTAWPLPDADPTGAADGSAVYSDVPRPVRRRQWAGSAAVFVDPLDAERAAVLRARGRPAEAEGGDAPATPPAGPATRGGLVAHVLGGRAVSPGGAGAAVPPSVTPPRALPAGSGAAAPVPTSSAGAAAGGMVSPARHWCHRSPYSPVPFPFHTLADVGGTAGQTPLPAATPSAYAVLPKARPPTPGAAGTGTTRTGQPDGDAADRVFAPQLPPAFYSPTLSSSVYRAAGGVAGVPARRSQRW